MLVTTVGAAAPRVAPEGWWLAGEDDDTQNGDVRTSFDAAAPAAAAGNGDWKAMGAGLRRRLSARSGRQQSWPRVQNWRRSSGRRAPTPARAIEVTAAFAAALAVALRSSWAAKDDDST